MAKKMKKPRLSFWQIWNMSFGFLGIQFGFALQNANVSRIFETLGADVERLALYWLAAPVTGLIVQPIIGYMSDRTWNRLGRRRPYFLVGALLSSVALVIMPNSPQLWIAVGMLWIMDASINITMEPFRAYVGDMLPSDQRTLGFSMQSFFIGIGAVVASALPWMMTNWLGISNVAPEGVIPDSVKWSFYIGAAVFLTAVLWTIILTREYSPEQLKSFEEAEDVTAEAARENLDRPAAEELANVKMRLAPVALLLGIGLSALIAWMGWAQELYILSGGVAAFGLLQFIAGWMQRGGRTESGLVVILDDLHLMPKTMKQLAVVQFFSWFALFAMWIYTTAGVTSHIYDMKLNQQEVAALAVAAAELEGREAETWYSRLPGIRDELGRFETRFIDGESNVVITMRIVNFFIDEDKDLQLPPTVRDRLLEIQQEYNRGADWVGVSFSVYNGFAALVAFLLPVLALYTNRRITHAIALICGSAGLISIYFISNPTMILVSMIGVGIAWASILAMPYAILAGSLPAEKMGIYMGIFNFFIVLPQILAASILGFIIGSVFGGQAIYALFLGGLSWVIAAAMVLFVDDVDDPEKATTD
jgi:maltose/moltooligosaccharide transporter